MPQGNTPTFMDVDWGRAVQKVAEVERLPSVLDLPMPEKPVRSIMLPEDPSLLSDEEVVLELQIASGWHSYTEAIVGMYSSAEEYLASQYRDAEIDVYQSLFPDGKPKGVTVDEAKIYVEADEKMREYRERLVGVRMALHGAKGYSKAYGRISMNYAMIMKYRHFSGDRSGVTVDLPEHSEWSDQ